MQAMELKGGLYVVSTPIGNLEDITLRALKTLNSVDFVLCEDSRVTQKLTGSYGISAKFLMYHEHNAHAQRPLLLEKLRSGRSLALVSDAGTPCLADPGFKLVRDARLEGTPVFAVPGPSAITAAMSISGMPTDRFTFQGFLPPKQKERFQLLQTLKHTPASIVFFEAPHRLMASLASCLEVFGDRECAILREITKIYEETLNGSLKALIGRLEKREKIRGEFVVIIGPPEEKDQLMSAEETDAAILEALKHHKPAKAARLVAAMSGEDRQKVYQRMLQLKEQE